MSHILKLVSPTSKSGVLIKDSHVYVVLFLVNGRADISSCKIGCCWFSWLLRAFTRLRSTEEGSSADSQRDDNISRAEIRKWSPLLSLGMNCQLNFCQISTSDTVVVALSPTSPNRATAIYSFVILSQTES